MNQHPPLTKADRQVLALQRKARKYPSAKGKIKQIREKQRINNWLAQ